MTARQTVNLNVLIDKLKRELENNGYIHLGELESMVDSNKNV